MFYGSGDLRPVLLYRTTSSGSGKNNGSGSYCGSGRSRSTCSNKMCE